MDGGGGGGDGGGGGVRRVGRFGWVQSQVFRYIGSSTSELGWLAAWLVGLETDRLDDIWLSYIALKESAAVAEVAREAAGMAGRAYRQS